MVADSSSIAVGKVVSQEVVELEMPYTISTVEVSASFAPPELAANVPPSLAAQPLKQGQHITVRQMGTHEYESTPAPILNKDGKYLLFLNPSGLEGEAASHYFVTGGSAGLYAADDFVAGGSAGTDDDDSGFSAVPSHDGELFHDGDKLPPTLTPLDLAG
jgi:hypothetical protein